MIQSQRSEFWGGSEWVRLLLPVTGAAASSRGRPPWSDVDCSAGGGRPVLGVWSHQQCLPPHSALLDFLCAPS